jgi:hypothetical protein
MWRFLYTALLVISIPSAEAQLPSVSYDLPLASFIFSPGSPSHYSSPYIHFFGNDGAQYSQRVERGGYYSIVVSAGIGLKSIAPAPIALFLDGLPQGHGPDPASGSDYVWNVTGQHSVADYVARNIYLYPGNHTVALQCLECSLAGTTARIGSVTVVLTSTEAPPPEPAGSRDPTIQPLRSYNIWNRAIGGEAIWSKRDDADTQAIVHSANGATINSGCWSFPVYVAQTRDPIGYFATPTNNVMPISFGYHTPLAAGVRPSCGTDTNITLYDPTHRYMQEFLGCSALSGPTRGYRCYDNLVTDVCEGQNPTGTFTSWTPGLIRVSEIQKGLIPHMLRYAMPATMTKPPAKWWQVAWPQYQVDICAATCYSGVVPAGATVGIPSTIDLNTLGLTPAGLALATALQNYGAIQRATGGAAPQGIILYAEQAAETKTKSQLADMRSDFPTIQPYLRIMRNQSSNNVNGGGNPLEPPQPRIDQSICP